MIRKVKKSICMIVTVCMLFTGVCAITGYEAEGASKPKAPSISSTYGMTYSNISWSKVKKNVKGYVLYRDGKAIKTLGSNVRSYKDKGLKPGTTYTYKVRAYNIVKKKQWYNKKTKKWQTKKPKKKYRGKAKKRKVKVYGAYSGSLKIKTIGLDEYTGKFYGKTIRASECPVSFDVENICPKCKVDVGGLTATVTYDKTDGKMRCSTRGLDYSDKKNCHHCNSMELAGYYMNMEETIITDWFAKVGDDSGKLNIDTKAIDMDIKFNPKYDAGTEGPHITLNNKVYCFDCRIIVKKPSDLPTGWPNHVH